MTTASIRSHGLSRNPLFSFLDRQGSLPTADEEQLLARRIQRGCMRSRNELVERNLRLVLDLARKSRPRDEHELMDRIQAGSTGLIRAAEKFDPGRGFRFSTYATWWVRQAITRHRETTSDVADESGTPLSLDSSVGDDGGTTLGDLLEDPNADDPAAEAERRDLKQVIEQHLATLEPPTRRAVRLRYGIDTGAPETIQRIANELGVDVLNARRLTAGGLRQLQREAVDTCLEVHA
jgi:RNA polymerase sigma factor (sigma-70 family)